MDFNIKTPIRILKSNRGFGMGNFTSAVSRIGVKI